MSRVYREGDKLLADFTDMPTAVYEMVKAGLYRFVSVELLKNVQAGTREIPWVLDAVALLGADQPAVGTLNDLQSLTMARRSALRARARVAFRRDTKFFSTGVRKAMDENEVKALLKQQADELKAAFTAQLKAEVDKVKAESKAEADAQVAKAKAEAHRAQIKERFEAAVKAEALLPAKRESFYKFNRVDDDATVMDIKLEDVDAYIAEFGDKEKLSRKPQSKQSTGAPEEVGKSAAEVVVMRARKLCFERSQDPSKFEHIHAATLEVLNADKALGDAYKLLGDAPSQAA